MAGKTILSDRVLSIVHTFGQQLRRANIEYEKLIVFGSQAKGKAMKWSDIDVCVVSKIFGQDRQGERVQLMSVCDDTTLHIEPHPYNATDLQNPWDPLGAEIRRYGITAG